MDIFETDSTYVASTYKRFPIALDHGKGSVVYDTDGKKYTDLGSGIAVNGFGICDDEWKAAVIAQMDKLPHSSNLYYTDPCARLAKMLCERTGMKKVFFANSGAESNECAIKTARKYNHDKYGDKRENIVTLINSFHGRTITTLSATGQDVFHKDFGPFTPGFVYLPANDIGALAKRIEKGDIGAIMFEMIQGEGGVMPLDRDFVSKAAKLAKENDVLFIVDEVQSGNGRTGKLYSYEYYDITPDIVTTAKGIGGGLPIGVAMLGEKVENTLTYGSHGSTFGGNPMAAAGACSIISRIDEKLLSSVRAKSEYIFSTLTGAKNVVSVNGIGLMLGIETTKKASDIAAECMKRGVLVLTAKDRVRLLPALNIPDEMLHEAIETLKKVIEE